MNKQLKKYEYYKCNHNGDCVLFRILKRKYYINRKFYKHIIKRYEIIKYVRDGITISKREGWIGYNNNCFYTYAWLLNYAHKISKEEMELEISYA